MGAKHCKRYAGVDDEYNHWQIIEDKYESSNNHHYESIFALGNGYMGLRGMLEEGYSGLKGSTTPGVYLNGVYASEPIFYGEEAPDQPKLRQTMVNLTNWIKVDLFLEDEKFDMLQGEIIDYRRVLDMQEGSLTRKLIWRSPSGRAIEVKIKRFISLVRKHIGVVSYSFTPLNFNGRVSLISEMEGDVQNHHHLRNKKPLKVADKGFNEERGYLLHKIESTGILTGAIMDNVLNLPENSRLLNQLFYLENERIINEFDFEVEEGKSYNLIKYAGIGSSLDLGEPGSTQEDIEKEIRQDIKKDIGKEKMQQEMEDEIEDGLFNILNQALDRATSAGWDELIKEQEEYLDKFWNDIDVRVKGDPAIQQGLRFNAFHLLQSTGKNGKTSVAAKGLTGEFYEGHFFWDTEAYILPFYIYSRPEIARKLLLFRYHTLDQARVNARRLKLAGALYPWRTINGEEASGFFMGSTVQYHIDADIAYGVHLYTEATKDYDFLYNYGAEILIETARMWVSRGSYIDLMDGKFCFNEVCGPDEYKPGVNNNCYTNYMAKFNLEYAIKVIERMEKAVPAKLAELQERLNLQPTEIREWKNAAREIYLPYNKDLKIHPQDDSFLYKDPIDLKTIPDEEFPLVRNWHPLIIWRYQVIKQADVILLMVLQGNEFSLQEKKANYDYYEPRTTHDSSLSPAIYSIIASEIGYENEAYNYFMRTVRIDLDDYNKNAYQGIHTACMAGSWMALVMGFGGMRNYDGVLHFNPILPDSWENYEFKIKFQGRQLKIKIDHSQVYYKLLKGDNMKIIHHGKELEIDREGTCVQL